VDDYQVEVLLSLALVAGGYALADALHRSGPIAMVVAGLLIGNHGRLFAMSDTTCQHLEVFWELIDEVLNAVLFVLLGLEVLAVTFTGRYLVAGLLAVPAVLLARFLSVGLLVWLLRRFAPVGRGAVRMLTWGGLRGALSVAMALSLPRGVAGEAVPEWDVILVVTYVVVVFSVLVQGLTIGPLTRRWLTGAARPRGEKARAAGVSAEAGNS
jgi:CPA1 family monovalent cation:H+ antiporter